MPFWPEHGLNQIAQDLPIVARLARAAHGAIEPLQAALAVDHRAALFGETERGQNGGRDSVASFARMFMSDEGGQRLELGDGKADLDRVFPEAISAFDPARCDAIGNLAQSGPGDRGHAEQPRAVGVRIAIGAQENVIAWTRGAERCRSSCTPRMLARAAR